MSKFHGPVTANVVEKPAAPNADEYQAILAELAALRSAKEAATADKNSAIEKVNAGTQWSYLKIKPSRGDRTAYLLAQGILCFRFYPSDDRIVFLRRDMGKNQTMTTTDDQTKAAFALLKSFGLSKDKLQSEFRTARELDELTQKERPGVELKNLGIEF